jgi:acetyl esterase
VRIYRPASAPADAKLPCLVYAHGGGWVFGNLDSHDVLCAQFALEAGIVVFAIDYRLAPEARFPGAFDDVVAGLKWVAANGGSIGIDSSKLAIGGDSAGGNLAAAVAIWARDNGGPKLPPAASCLSGDRAVGRAPRSLSPLRGRLWAECRHHGMVLRPYTPDKAGRGRWRVSPLRARSLAGLPPALVITRATIRCATRAAPMPSACSRKAPRPISWSSAACCTAS